MPSRRASPAAESGVPSCSSSRRRSRFRSSAVCSALSRTLTALAMSAVEHRQRYIVKKKRFFGATMDIMLQYALVATPIGTLVLIASDTALRAVHFGEIPSGRDLVEASDPLGAVTCLRAYFAGDVHALDNLPIEPGG